MKGITSSEGLAILLNGQILTILIQSDYGMDFIGFFLDGNSWGESIGFCQSV